ncbi:MAG: C-GCAxxG-C-C family protein [Oscillospiraceae bacterium]|jgi:C_GCAxxG_C_C family probable redox protein|nr:C-GCAxxG-C-C family protein [Oscillospiraceae bacterium]
MTKAERAAGLFSGGFNCAQAVFGAFSDELGLDRATALKLSSGFGGGVRAGELCGAVSGGVMAIGLLCGFHTEKDLQQKGYCYQKTREFVEKFKEANGSLNCRELLRSDVRCPDGRDAPGAQAARKPVCPCLVTCAVRLLERMEFTREE